MSGDRNYVEQVVASRPKSVVSGRALWSIALLCVALLFVFATIGPFPNSSPEYRVALRRTRIASAGLALFFATQAILMMANAARGYYGIPGVKRLGHRSFVVFRNIATGFFLIVLLAMTSEPLGNKPGGYGDHRLTVVLFGYAIWLASAIDLIPVWFRIRSARRARVSSSDFEASSVGGKELGAVRIIGRIVSSGQDPEAGLAPETVYQCTYDGEQSERKLVPFLLEKDGHRLFVDVVPESTIVVPAARDNQVLCTGDEVEVWGTVSRSEQAYRGGLARMTAGSGRLYIFQGKLQTLNRRLVSAANIELGAIVGSVVVAASFGLYYYFFQSI